MKIAYFDCQFGAAGDMLLACLIDAGLDCRQWLNELRGIALPENSFDVVVEDVIRCTITGKKVNVLLNPKESRKQEHQHNHNGELEHGRALKDEIIHDTQERSVKSILEIIQNSKITDKAKIIALSAFRNLGLAESQVHGISFEDVHLHELGAVDAIVDIVGFAIAYDMLRIERSIVSPLPLGGGTVRTAHGIFPVPAPAVPIMLANAAAKISGAKIEHECLTPTGAALLTTIAHEWRSFPPMERITSIGYGAGSLDPKNYPNVCRVFTGEGVVDSSEQTSGTVNDLSHEGAAFASEIICVLEANIDDLSPQTLAYAVERLFDADALDVSVTPIVMKKGRSGHLLTVLCKPDRRAGLEDIILRQTSTLGVRSHLVERLVACREYREVTLSGGSPVRIKVALDLQGRIVNALPEYDDCARFAQLSGRPLKEVLIEALAKLKQEEKCTEK